MCHYKKTVCPHCGKKAAIEIVYGMLPDNLNELGRQGLLVTGGCCLDYDSPNMYCRWCKRTWGKALNRTSVDKS